MDPKVWSRGHSSPPKQQSYELPNAGRTWGKPPHKWRSLEGSSYLGWAVNDSEPCSLYMPVTGGRQGAVTRFFMARIQWQLVDRRK